MSRERNYGLDLCRILAMLGIVIIHILGSGGIFANLSESSYSFWSASLLQIIILCSVNVFAMLSGVLCWKKPSVSSSRILDLLSTIFFYSIPITIVFRFVIPSSCDGIKSLIKNIVPMFAGRYWYITGYLLLFFLMPCLNLLIRKLSEKSLIRLSIVLFILLSVVAGTTGDLFVMNAGCSPAWLIVCYLWGATISKCNLTVFKRHEWIVFLLCIIAGFSLRLLCYRLTGSAQRITLTFVSPTIVLSAVAVVQFFARTQLTPPRFFKKALVSLSAVSFDVYILHCNILIIDYCLKDAFLWVLNNNALLVPVLIVFSAIVIYLAGTITGLFRKAIYNIAGINRLILWLSKKLDKVLSPVLNPVDDIVADKS